MGGLTKNSAASSNPQLQPFMDQVEKEENNLGFQKMSGRMINAESQNNFQELPPSFKADLKKAASKLKA
jgi:hypothetical protein